MGIKSFQLKLIYLNLVTGDFLINGQSIELKNVTDFRLILGQGGWELDVKQDALAPIYENCAVPTLEAEEGN